MYQICISSSSDDEVMFVNDICVKVLDIYVDITHGCKRKRYMEPMHAAYCAYAQCSASATCVCMCGRELTCVLCVSQVGCLGNGCPGNGT